MMGPMHRRIIGILLGGAAAPFAALAQENGADGQTVRGTRTDNIQFCFDGNTETQYLLS